VLGRIFPKQFDNTYRGHWLGLVLFALIVVLKALQGFESVISPEFTMVRADGIPLDKFDALASSEVVLMFALLGTYLIVIPLQSVVVLIRYRSMVPFMLLTLIAVQLGVRLVHALYPTLLEIQGRPAPFALYVNLGILAATLIAFILSLLRPATRGTPMG
jgi:hypothetical protein